jgi:hypothetical protein
MMTGTCNDCRLGAHENCKLVIPSDSGMLFCSCECGGMSLGAPTGSMPKVPDEIKKEFPELPPQ